MLDKLTKDQLECFYHASLVKRRIVKFGTASADRNLAALLTRHRSFKGIWVNEHGMFDDGLDSDLEKIAKKIRNHEFRTITINHPDYPESMRSVADSSPVLYVQGDISLLSQKPSIAVVGTRNLEDHVDIEEEKAIVQRLLEKGHIIISGLASGCDTLAHMYAIGHGGRTIAVLGNPLSSFYPMENKEVQKEIGKDHLLISQYPIGARTYPSHFAHRNKTTVGLASEGIVVIRAGDAVHGGEERKTSGTLNAVRECVKQGKVLYVLYNNFCQGYEWPDNITEKLKRMYGEDHKKYLKIPNMPGGE